MVNLDKGISLRKPTQGTTAFYADLGVRSDALTKGLRNNCLYTLRHTFRGMVDGKVTVK